MSAAWEVTDEFRRKYGSHGRVRRLKHEPCAVCKSPMFSVNAHCPPPGESGTGYKASWEWVVPLCLKCHNLRDELHGSNAAFLDATGVDLGELAKMYAEKFPPEDWPDDGLAY